MYLLFLTFTDHALARIFPFAESTHSCSYTSNPLHHRQAEEACVRAVKTFVERMVVNPGSRGGGGRGHLALTTETKATANTAFATANSLPIKEKAAAVAAGIEEIAASFGACPYTKSADWAATGLEKQGVEPGPVGYMFEACSDALDGMAAVLLLYSSMIT